MKAELEALNNSINYHNLIGYKIHEYYQQDKRKTKQLYFLTDDKGTSLTGYWDYSQLNYFITGYGKAQGLPEVILPFKKKADKLKATNAALLNALKDAEDELSKWQQSFTEDEDLPKVLDTIKTAIRNAETN